MTKTRQNLTFYQHLPLDRRAYPERARAGECRDECCEAASTSRRAASTSRRAASTRRCGHIAVQSTGVQPRDNWIGLIAALLLTLAAPLRAPAAPDRPA